MSMREESRQKFEKQGVFLTKHHLWLDNMEPVEKQEILSWLAETEKRSKRLDTLRFRWMLGFTIVAAVTGSIAACPVVREMLRSFF